MILHTVNKSPFHHDALRACLRVAGPDDSILLIEDGVYGAIDGGPLAALVQETGSRCKVHVLVPDLAARGITDALADGIEGIDDAGFVELTVRNQSVVSWF